MSDQHPEITDQDQIDEIREFQFQGKPDLRPTTEAEMEEIADRANHRNSNKQNQAR
jgi:hypothetical protein